MWHQGAIKTQTNWKWNVVNSSQYYFWSAGYMWKAPLITCKRFKSSWWEFHTATVSICTIRSTQLASMGTRFIYLILERFDANWQEPYLRRPQVCKGILLKSKQITFDAGKLPAISLTRPNLFVRTLVQRIILSQLWIDSIPMKKITYLDTITVPIGLVNKQWYSPTKLHKGAWCLTQICYSTLWQVIWVLLSVNSTANVLPLRVGISCP